MRKTFLPLNAALKYTEKNYTLWFISTRSATRRDLPRDRPPPDK